jgi:hypothetical protein
MTLRCPFARRTMCVRSGRRVISWREPCSERSGSNAHRTSSPVVQDRFLQGSFTSIRLINAVVENVPLRGGEYNLLVFMARYAQDDGTQVFPSVARLAHDSRQNERSVRRQLRGLEAKGYIQRVGVSKHNTFNYRILPERCYPQGEGLAPPVKVSTRAQKPLGAGFGANSGGTAPPDSSSNTSKNRQEHLDTPQVKPVSYAVEMVLKSLKNRPVKESP